MSRTFRRATTPRQVTSLDGRIYELERRLRDVLAQQAGGGDGNLRPVFDHPASTAVAVGISTKTFRFDVAVTIIEIRLFLPTAGTSTSTFRIYQNGVAVGPVLSLVAGATEVVESVSLSFAEGDDLAVGFVALGAGAGVTGGAVAQMVAVPA